MTKDDNNNIVLWGEKCRLYRGRIEHFHIERSETELNKDGSFKGWDPTDDFNANPEEYYAFAGDSYTMEFVFPSNLLINNKRSSVWKQQKLRFR